MAQVNVSKQLLGFLMNHYDGKRFTLHAPRPKTRDEREPVIMDSVVFPPGMLERLLCYSVEHCGAVPTAFGVLCLERPVTERFSEQGITDLVIEQGPEYVVVDSRHLARKAHRDIHSAYASSNGHGSIDLILRDRPIGGERPYTAVQFSTTPNLILVELGRQGTIPHIVPLY